MESSPDQGSSRLKHLRLLVDHLQHTYASTAQHLKSLLQNGWITYELLWALFKPDCHVYTTCFGTGERRCVVFDACEETTQDDMTFYKLQCRFLDYNGAKFGEACQGADSGDQETEIDWKEHAGRQAGKLSYRQVDRT